MERGPAHFKLASVRHLALVDREGALADINKHAAGTSRMLAGAFGAMKLQISSPAPLPWAAPGCVPACRREVFYAFLASKPDSSTDEFQQAVELTLADIARKRPADVDADVLAGAVWFVDRLLEKNDAPPDR